MVLNTIINGKSQTFLSNFFGGEWAAVHRLRKSQHSYFCECRERCDRQLNYHCNLKSVDIRWTKFSSKLIKLTNSFRSEKTSCFKLLELRVSVFIFLSDDNGTRSASFSSSKFFLVF